MVIWFMVTAGLAAEGYWQPGQVDDLAPQLEELGIEIPAEEWADLEAGPLAAVVHMGGCSGAFVSPEGLIATAYHCVGRAVTFATREGEDLYHLGFYAEDRASERETGGTLTVRVTTGVRDVTTQVLAGTRRLSGEAFTRRLQTNISSLVARCEGAAGVRCEVANFDLGRQYNLITQREIDDVRLVMVPPHDVGYFGGDADNWQWPRHSGDFAFLRAYVPDGDGEPVPFQPRRHLPVSTGPSPGDGVVVAGYPGGTFRWLNAAELEYAAQEDYRRTIATSRELRDIAQRWTGQVPDLTGKLTSQMLSLSNTVQYLEGNLVAFERMRAVERKWALDNAVAQWVLDDPVRSESYGNVINDVHRLTVESRANADLDHLLDQMMRHVSMVDVSVTLWRVTNEALKPDSKRAEGYRNRDRPDIEKRMATATVGYDWRVDRDMLRALLTRMHELPQGLHIPELDRWFDNLPAGGTLEERLDQQLVKLYANSTVLANEDERARLINSGPTFLDRSDVPFFDLAKALTPYLEHRERTEDVREAEWAEVRPLYLDAVQSYLDAQGGEGGTRFYADANRTMRISLGTVKGYNPRDGLTAEPRTTLVGLADRVGDPPFAAPAALVDAIAEHSAGDFADPSLGDVSVNYLSSADTTLGNSGSPTIDSKGNWVGVLFDGNYESMATDWIFDDEVIRSIHADSSYVLWYLQHVVGADALLAELTPGVDRG